MCPKNWTSFIFAMFLVSIDHFSFFPSRSKMISAHIWNNLTLIASLHYLTKTAVNIDISNIFLHQNTEYLIKHVTQNQSLCGHLSSQGVLRVTALA